MHYRGFSTAKWSGFIFKLRWEIKAVLSTPGNEKEERKKEKEWQLAIFWTSGSDLYIIAMSVLKKIGVTGVRLLLHKLTSAPTATGYHIRSWTILIVLAILSTNITRSPSMYEDLARKMKQHGWMWHYFYTACMSIMHTHEQSQLRLTICQNCTAVCTNDL